ncbi:9007_t:CDS:2 [Diversispora eburnea]|uniref:9007_t:CDS:1 n=1 Tax=Diversispora eburnea TaxID=1213867 RepID=A0A9N8ZK19_9GLOM|nr:9007_t:CDS:2 [Diversispora eburnea]
METYFGYVKTPQDAILLFEACRMGILSRIQRRLSEKERSSIRSGSVFVWDEREAGMRRWTDGKSWSASRVSGSFLTYRELESKRKSNSRGSNNPHDLSSEDTDSSESYHSSNKKSSSISSSATEQCRYKHGGLVKQSFSITTTSHQKLHLICYYTKADVINEKLQIPTHDEKLKIIHIPKGIHSGFNVNNDPMERSISPIPFPWQIQSHNSHQQQHHRLSAEPMQFDSHSPCSTPSFSSSPSTTEEDLPNFYGRHSYLQHHAGSSGFGNGTQPINIPAQRYTFPPPQFSFPASYPPHSQSGGVQLPPQDIPWEKVDKINTEDQRQLNAIYTTLKL